jgi:protein-disulfide isomerase
MLRFVAILGGVALFAVAAAIFLCAGEAPTSGSASSYTPPVRGNPDAPVTVTEFGDFQCPSCGAFARSVEPELIRRYIDTGKAKLVFRHFPWIGPESRRAAEAASCAGAQDRFWEYHDLLYAQQHGENSGFLSADTLKRLASQLALDRGAFDACLDGGVYRAAVDADFQEVRRLGLNATPSFLVNGQRIVGAQSFSTFAAVIDAKLAGR